MLLLPLAIHSAYHHGCYQLHVDWFFLFVTALSYAVYCTAFVMALDYTSVGNAVIFGNSQAIILLIGRVLMGHHLALSEALGATVAFLGAILCSKDSKDGTTTEGPSSLRGDALALFSGGAGVIYLVFAKKVRPCMTLYVFMFFIMSLSSCFVLLFMLLSHQELSLDRQMDTGLFGWMNWAPHRLGLEIVMVVVCNILGSTGYVRAMQDFDNLVIAVASLMEPVVAEIMALALGVGVLPGLVGWIGNLLVMVGTMAVVMTKSAQSNDLH